MIFNNVRMSSVFFYLHSLYIKYPLDYNHTAKWQLSIDFLNLLLHATVAKKRSQITIKSPIVRPFL